MKTPKNRIIRRVVRSNFRGDPRRREWVLHATKGWRSYRMEPAQ